MNRAQIILKFGCGRRSRTFIFGFKARRVAGYTIPQERMTGHWNSNPDPRADLALKSLIRRLLYQLSYTPSKLVAVEGIEPTSLDYQSSALAVELHREIG